MAAFNLSPIGNGWQFFGGNTAGSSPNIPLAGGQLQTYAAGTNTPTVTYSNNLGSIANPVVIILDSTGRTPNEIWFPSLQAYKFILADSTGALIATYDNLVGINDTGTASAITSEWIASGFTPVYGGGGNTFSVAGNATSTFQIGRRVKATVTGGTAYGSITSSVFAAGSTTVVAVYDATPLDNGLTVVNVALLGESNPSVPAVINYTLNLANINLGTVTGNAVFLSPIVTSGITGPGLPVSKFKSVFTDRSSTITLSNDPDLTVIIATNGTYDIECLIHLSGVGSGAGGIALNLNYSGTFTTLAASSVYYGSVTNVNVAGQQQGTVRSTQTAIDASFVTIVNSSTLADQLFIKATLVVTGSGTFAFSWAQNASNVNATRLFPGSYMKITRMG